jgi:hypothetical protein
LFKKAVALLGNLLFGSPENKVKIDNSININAKSKSLLGKLIFDRFISESRVRQELFQWIQWNQWLSYFLNRLLNLFLVSSLVGFVSSLVSTNSNSSQ